MTSGEDKKAVYRSFQFQLSMYWWYPECLYQDFFYHTKGFEVAGHYSNLKYWR